MEISPMPPISEDCLSQGESEMGDEGDSNFEQLMVSMLEERDKLQESLRETQDLLQNTIARLQEVEKEKNLFQTQLEKEMPTDMIVLTREVNQLKEQIIEREEEINELKAERNNTRLLLEHLESLVSRHEKSLRMTVVKRQSQMGNNSGVSSEAEVLKALKSLFEHHKALDERYRERYKTAIERCHLLEEEVEKLKSELKIEKDSKQLTSQYMESIHHSLNLKEANGTSETTTVTTITTSEQSKENGSEPAAASILSIELQNALEKQSKELAESRVRLSEMQNKLKDFEEKNHMLDEKYTNLNRDYLNSIETNRKLQLTQKEMLVQKEEHERRLSNLEQRYIQSQRECSTLNDMNNRLETELAIKENSLKHNEEKYKNLQTKYENSEQKYETLIKKNQSTSNNSEADSLPKNPLITHFQDKHLNIEEKIQALQSEIEDTKMELNRARQREKMSEEHNMRLTQTVDKLLSESNERLQMHLKERMHSLDEKNTLTQECEKLRKQIEEIDADKNKLNIEMERIRNEYELTKNLNQSLNLKIRDLTANLSKTLKLQSQHQLYASNQKMNFGQFTPTGDVNPHTGGSGGTGAVVTTPTNAKIASYSPLTISPFNNINSNAHPISNGIPNAQTINLNLTAQQNEHHAQMHLPHNYPASIKMPDTNDALQHQQQQQYNQVIDNDWDKLEEAAKVIANVQEAFESTEKDYQELNGNSIYSNTNTLLNNTTNSQSLKGNEVSHFLDEIYDLYSNPNQTDLNNKLNLAQKVLPQTDAQTIAILLQKQLEEIDNEIRLIKVEKQSTELRAVELESRVNNIQSDNYIQSNSPMNSEQSTPSNSKSDLYKFAFEKTKEINKFMTAPAGMSLNYMEMTYNQEIDPNESNFHDKKSHSINMYSKQTAGNHNWNSQHKHEKNYLNNENQSPDSSKNSSNESLNFEFRKDSYGSHSHCVNTNEELMSNLNKKKTLRNALYKIFSQRKKVQKVRTGEKSNEKFGSNSNYETNYYADPQSLNTIKTEPDKKIKKKQELLEEVMESGLPFQSWNGPTIVAWLELWVGMPAWYVAACKANVKSGSIMSALSDAEIHREIGINNSLHRLKLRIAIQEMINLTSISSHKTSPSMCLAFGEMNHEWIGNVWLKHLGLSQYRSYFMECLIDARMLDHLTKKDLRGQLKMVDSFHRSSLQYGTCVLKKINYDKNELLRRQIECESKNFDLIVWSNERVIKWVQTIGLKDYANNLDGSGLHGGVLMFDESYDWNAMALALEIPIHDTTSRKILENEFKNLLAMNHQRSISKFNLNN